MTVAKIVMPNGKAYHSAPFFPQIVRTYETAQKNVHLDTIGHKIDNHIALHYTLFTVLVFGLFLSNG